jgi:predicted Rossmann fold nucleotide-binding protein DprA/Smf involved in DNA uptake
MKYKHVVNILDYPELKPLHFIKPKISSLNIRGQYIPDIFTNCAAVVGSRRLTHYGRQVIDKLIPRLVLQGKTIVLDPQHRLILLTHYPNVY